MKSSMATALSVTGILAAGGIALAANTNLLDGGVSTVKGSPAQAAAVVTTSTLVTDPPAAGSNDGSGASPVSTVAKSGVAAKDLPADPADPADPTGGSTDTTVPTSGSTDTTYTVPGVGNVTVTVTDGVLEVSNVDESAGWTYTIQYGMRGYTVLFENSQNGTAYEFHVALIDGRIVTSIENVTDTPAPPTPPNYDDDDDDDQYEHHDEDHEDHEDHEEEDDD